MGSESRKEFEERIADLAKQLEEAKQSANESNTQAELLSQNLKMEQDTSNNLLVSLGAAQS